MIKEIGIENYKSIQELKIELGRVTVLIGENGCGKTNILEAIALSSAAAADKLDNEFLASRGIRVTDSQFMRSAFNTNNLNKEIKITLQFQQDKIITYNLQHDGKPYSSWVSSISVNPEIADKIVSKPGLANIMLKILQDDNRFYLPEQYLEDAYQATLKKLLPAKDKDILTLTSFLIFSPENSSLRIFNQEGQIQPLGIKGEGLFKLLTVLSLEENQGKLQEIKEKMQLIDWFEDLAIPHKSNLSLGERVIQIKDKYLAPELDYFTQNSSNEGFLFLLFYFCLFISDDTPKIFAVDNIDVSLNPRLGRRLVKELVELAKRYDRQVIFTTHNPAILDGLNLDDDEQKLFVIYRNKLGHTKARRILSPKPLEGQEPVRLSEAFLRGYIGGLPKNF